MRRCSVDLMTKQHSPEAVERMTDVYKRAVQELDLSRAPAHERDRLAVYILSIGKLDDPHRMLLRDHPSTPYPP